MPLTKLLNEYVAPLIAGNRVACRKLIRDELAKHEDSSTLYRDLLWPAMDRVEELYREDHINGAAENMATRINRSIADQLQLSLHRGETNGKRIVITCPDTEPEELGAQMSADLFEADGWDVYFLGGGVPNDEIVNLLGQLRPDILLVFGTHPRGVPGIRHLVDMIRDIGINPTMNIMVSGGVYNRADGLWQELNVDLFAESADKAIEVANQATPRIPTPIDHSAPRKRRRRRRPPLLTTAQASS